MNRNYNPQEYQITVRHYVNSNIANVIILPLCEDSADTGFYLVCQLDAFQKLLASLSSAWRIELKDYDKLGGQFKRINVYAGHDIQLIGSFDVTGVILENKEKMLAKKEDVDKLYHLLFTLAQTWDNLNHPINPLIKGEVKMNHEYKLNDYKISAVHHTTTNTDTITIRPKEDGGLNGKFSLSCSVETFKSLVEYLGSGVVEKLEVSCRDFDDNNDNLFYNRILLFDKSTPGAIKTFEVTWIVLEGEEQLAEKEDVIKIHNLLHQLNQSFEQIPINPETKRIQLKGVKFDYNAEQYDLVIDVLPNTVDKVVHIRANESMDMGEGDVQFSLSCYLRTFNDIVEHLMTASRLELHDAEQDDGVYGCVTIYDINTGESTDFHVMGATLEENATIAENDNLNKIFHLVRNLLKEYCEAHPENKNKRIYSPETLAQIAQQGRQKLEELREKGITFVEERTTAEHHPK